PYLGDEIRVVENPYAVPDPLGVPDVEDLADALRPGRLAGVVDQVHAGLAGGVADRGERRGRERLVAGQPDADDAAAGVPASEVERPPGPLDRPAARMVEQHPAFDAVLLLALRQP